MFLKGIDLKKMETGRCGVWYLFSTLVLLQQVLQKSKEQKNCVLRAHSPASNVMLLIQGLKATVLE